MKNLVVFRNILKLPVFRALAESDDAEFLHALYEDGADLSKTVLRAILNDDNIYVRLTAQGKDVPEVIVNQAERELTILQALCDRRDSRYNASPVDLKAAYAAYLSDCSVKGYGIFRENVMFRVDGDEIVPITSPDEVSVDSLIGYEAQRNELLANTRALLAGLPAANALLVGDAGTGKSTTVKAAVNLYAKNGLRLIELRKSQLHDLPKIMEKLRENPLKFIIFVDDLSFTKNDDDFSVLKAILEGSASVKAPNAVIYATSNRRHLVKESFSDREGDEIHLNDTIQELMSLSNRFGLSILFTKPSKKVYLDIVHGLCGFAGIPVSDELDIKAAAFSLNHGGFTPRSAEQFVNSVISSKVKE
ncbi:MAG: ATP-binding protein [Oscillospiraceae bacterium]|nr:ATP-binding protein [Oscillospiraceae bacterium]